jgi:hypothetical protein
MQEKWVKSLTNERNRYKELRDEVQHKLEMAQEKLDQIPITK